MEEVEVVEGLLPENPSEITVDQTTSRFSGASWYDEIQKVSVTLAGVGGIGSWTAFLLGRLKLSYLYLFDSDFVDISNLSGQLFSIDDARYHKNKVHAIADMIRNYSNNYKIYTNNVRYRSEAIAGNIMICGFDNMESRSMFFNKWLSYMNNNDPSKSLFIDGRLAAEEFQIFAVQGNDERAIEEYKSKWLFDDSEAEATTCSYKQTSFTASMIASMIVNILVNFIANRCSPVLRDVPFMISYNASTMFTKIVM